MSDVPRPFSLKIWTSSHGLRSHFFPQALTRAFEENELIKFPIVDAVGGRLIDQNFVDSYKEDFDKIRDSDEPRISVLLLGDNNIRSYANKGAFRVFKYTKQIIELHKNTCHPLLVCGMMPSPKTIARTGIISEYVDDIIQEEITKLQSDPKGRFFGYVCTTSFFTDEEGFIISKKYYSKDGIHLNQLGAYSLANNILANSKFLADTVLRFAD